MSHISFLLGIHNHQPIGNFEEVFEEAYQKSYAPFLMTLLNYPSIKWNLHCTGILWEWIERKHPDFLEKVQVMVDRKQLELLSGGFYEPILAVLPDQDKIGQIQKLNDYLKKKFKIEAKGMWCAERVWEPHLPKFLREAGIEYTVLDDTHFLSVGLTKNQLNGYFKVEEQNSVIDIFPISQDLRYVIPFKDPEKSIEVFKEWADAHPNQDGSILVMADDGEKFGLWPDTYKLVYEKKWLEKFLRLLEKNSSWIKTQTFSDYRKANTAIGKVYLPTASYFEMSEWALMPGSAEQFEEISSFTSDNNDKSPTKKFLKKGIWRNFLAKYSESASMYKKMLRVSQKTHELAKDIERNFKTKIKQESPLYLQNSNLINQALNYLWAGQCNCSYWHGVFGGLYLPHLRQAIYKNLIDAENTLDSIVFNGHGKKEKSDFSVEVSDFDGDGKDEILFEMQHQNLYFSPSQGGSIFEWDFKPVSVNLLNVLTRRPETYHQKFVNRKNENEHPNAEATAEMQVKKNVDMNNILNYDWYRRSSLIDHFLHPHTTLESFKQCQYGEQGDFVLGRYEYEIPKTVPGDANQDLVKFSRQGFVWVGDQRHNILVEKIIQTLETCPDEQFPSPGSERKVGLRVKYRVQNLSDQPIRALWFAPEFNFAFSVPDKEKSPYEIQCSEWKRIDPHLFWQVAVVFSEPTSLWVLPLETISNSEGGLEKTYQGTILLPNWKFSLDGRQSIEKNITFYLGKL